MSTGTTTEVWFRADGEGAGAGRLRADVVPSLMGHDRARPAKLTEVAPSTTAPVPESILAQRFSLARFVSTNVLRARDPRRDPPGEALSASIDYQDQAFKFAFPHGARLSAPQRLYLFTVEADDKLKEALEALPDTDDLLTVGLDQLNPWRSKFSENASSLSRKVDVEKLDGGRWRIIDGNASPQREYVIEQEVDRYHVYRFPLRYTGEPGDRPTNQKTLLKEQAALPLSNNFGVLEEEAEKRWLVLDRDTRQGYLVQLDDNRLSIYDTPLQYVTFWKRQDNEPVVQTFPLSPTLDHGGFLDVNRGLIPFELLGQPDVTFDFRSDGLPAPPELDGIAQIAGSLATSRYFLPTLPGVEYDVKPGKTGLAWSYRHSVPVLDEAYAEVTEGSEDEETQTAGRANGRDMTRVAGTVAFEEGGKEAAGWVHKTAGNPKGTVPLEIESARLDGLNPEIKIKMGPDGSNGSYTFSRQEREKTTIPDKAGRPVEAEVLRSGLTWALKVGDDGSKVTLDADYEPDDGSKHHTYVVANNGQPLIAITDGAEAPVVTLDGEGVTQAEPLTGPVTYRYLTRSGEQAKGVRVTDSIELDSKESQHLELVNIWQSKESVGPDPYQESWMLHNGKSNWPSLAGFPLFPLKLEEIDLQWDAGNQLAAGIIKINAIWLHSEPPEQADYARPDDAGDAVTLTFKLNNNEWRFNTISGGIDWRFRRDADETADGLPRLRRLRARIAEGSSGTAPFKLDVTEVMIDFQLGLHRLPLPEDDSPVRVTIEAGKLEFEEDRLANETIEVDYKIKSIAVELNEGPDEIKDFRFIWKKSAELLAGQLRIPGTLGQLWNTTISVQRDTAAHHEFGLFRVDDAQGRIGDLLPGDPDYPVAALRRPFVDIPSHQTSLDVTLPAGYTLGAYLIQNSDRETFLKENPLNDPGQRPQAGQPGDLLRPR